MPVCIVSLKDKFFKKWTVLINTQNLLLRQPTYLLVHRRMWVVEYLFIFYEETQIFRLYFCFNFTHHYSLLITDFFKIFFLTPNSFFVSFFALSLSFFFFLNSCSRNNLFLINFSLFVCHTHILSLFNIWERERKKSFFNDSVKP